MKVLYEKSFFRDLKKINDQAVKNRIYDVIDIIKSSENFHSIPHIRKLTGHPNAYRIRLGNYRLGFFFENETVIFARFMDRKDIYNKFP